MTTGLFSVPFEQRSTGSEALSFAIAPMIGGIFTSFVLARRLPGHLRDLEMAFRPEARTRARIGPESGNVTSTVPLSSAVSVTG
jgi:hypothetical protein